MFHFLARLSIYRIYKGYICERAAWFGYDAVANCEDRLSHVEKLTNITFEAFSLFMICCYIHVSDKKLYSLRQ